ncbi:hypothetical protein [Shewanella sp.]|uniref:hypothetical protein n=1 Tax=Shewanella sp. TaxID=50422 RepID=UPI003A882D2D
MNNRKDYYIEYYKNNKQDIAKRRNLVYQQKQILSSFDKYFVDLSLFNETEKDNFHSKELVLKFKQKTGITLDYKLLLDVYKDFLLIAYHSIGKPTIQDLNLGVILKNQLLLSSFYKFMSTKSEFKDHRTLLLAQHDEIRIQHAKDLKTQEMLKGI